MNDCSHMIVSDRWNRNDEQMARDRSCTCLNYDSVH